MLAGRRYLLDLTTEQSAYAETVAGICRAVWNVGLEQRRAYRRRGAWVTYVQQARELAEAKKTEPWLTEAPSHCLQQALRDLDKACRTHATFKVRWRSARRWAPSFRFPDPSHIEVTRLNRRWGAVRLPKFGWVRFRWTRPIGGVIRNATVSRDGNRWYVSFCVEDGLLEALPNGKPAVGVDRGVKAAAVTSDGDFHDAQLITPGEAQRIRRLQQALARSLRIHGRNKRSNRRDAIRGELAALWARIRNRRLDWCAKLAFELCERYGLVVFEDLKIRNMTASAKGTAEAPGRNVRQKAGLNRAIASRSWGRLEVATRNRARYTGTQVAKTNPAFTSQICHTCGHCAPENRESQAVFRCVACGHQDHADVNAAKNIRAAGLAVPGRGDLAVGRSKKRQPPKAKVA
jgi:putative transposase